MEPITLDDFLVALISTGSTQVHETVPVHIETPNGPCKVGGIYLDPEGIHIDVVEADT